MKYQITAIDKDDLEQIIKQEIELNGIFCDLNHIDVSEVTDMSFLFKYVKFNGDISNWNVSNVDNMCGMFHNSEFNGDLSKWDVSNVDNMRAMFSKSKFTRDLSSWNPINLTCDIFMFESCSAPIPYWCNFDDLESRKKAIDSHDLNNQLDSELGIQIISKNKIKI